MSQFHLYGLHEWPPTVVYEDNQSAIALAKSITIHGRSKHIDVKYHCVKDQVTKQTVAIRFCPTELLVADILSKAITQ